MRIAIDGRTIVGHRTGVGVYAERIVRSLLKIDHENEYFLFLVESLPELKQPNLEIRLIEGYHRTGPNRLWENVLLPRFIRRNSIDLFFAPAYTLPILPFAYRRRTPPERTRYVVTVHDLIGLLHPETFTRKMYLWQKIFIANAVRQADRIITGSLATKLDLLKLYRIDRKKVTVVHHSVDEDFRPLTDSALLERVRTRYGLPTDIILYLGTVEPRKNIGNLARAFAKLPKDVQDRFTLVIAGKPGWFANEIKAEIGQLQLDGKVRFLGYVDRSELPILYNLATVFVYPSIYEGFGFPPLEAMACGVPVLCSNTSSFPEVVGDAAIMVDPLNVDQLSHHLKQLLIDRGLRSELKSRGLLRAREFTPEETARKTLTVFQEEITR